MKNILNKKNLILILMGLTTIAFAQEGVSTKVNEMEARIDDLELKQALKKFSFSGSFQNQIESVYVNKSRTDLHDDAPSGLQSTLTSASDKDSYILPMFMRVDLNFDAQINSQLTFYSTLGMSKFWNMAGRSGRDGTDNPNFESIRGGYAYEDSRAHFDTAYLNYRFKDPAWSLAIGRMTTNNGPPVHQVDGVSRSGTYPFMSYNVIFDGLAVVHNFKKYLPKDHSLKMRLFYTPFIQVDDEDRSSQVIDDSDAGGSDENVESHGSLITLLTEYSYLNASWADKVDLFYSVYTFDKYYDDSRQFSEGTAPSGYEDYYNSGVDYEGTTSHTIYWGVYSIFKSRVNTSITLNHFDVRSTGAGVYKSDNYLFTLNYTFDNKTNGGDILGLEYINNDENRVPTDSTSLYANDFYNLVNGEGIHVYYTMPMGRNQILRFGGFKYSGDESELYKVDIKHETSVSYLSYKVFF